MNAKTKALADLIDSSSIACTDDVEVERRDHGFADLYWDDTEGIRSDGAIVVSFKGRSRVAAAAYVMRSYRVACLDSGFPGQDILGIMKSAEDVLAVMNALIGGGLTTAMSTFEAVQGIRAGGDCRGPRQSGRLGGRKEGGK